MLEKYVHNPTVVEKVTLLKSFQTGSEFATLPFASTRMDSIFRNRRLSMAVAPPTLSSSPVLAAQYGVPPSDAQVPPPTLRRTDTIASREASAPATPVSVPAQLNGNHANANGTTKSPSATTYATRVAVAPSPPPTPQPRPLPLFGNLGKDVVLVNDDEHRIDCALPPKSAAAVEKLHQKTHFGGKRYCNMFHLYGSCSGCNYLHDSLSAAEKIVLRHRLRGEKCHDRGRCRDPQCFYGHHCACPGSKRCGFPANMHNVDVSTWKEVRVG